MRLFKAASDRLFVRNYSIIPPDWLGGNIGKQIEGPPLEEWKNYQEKMEGNASAGRGRALCHPQAILSPSLVSYVYSKQPILGLTQEWFRELSFSRLECGVHDKLHISSAGWWDLLLPLARRAGIHIYTVAGCMTRTRLLFHPELGDSSSRWHLSTWDRCATHT